MAVCRVKETELFVKFPEEVRDQYSDVLFANKVASNVPPGFEVNDSTCAVTVPVPVVGLTNENGR